MRETEASWQVSARLRGIRSLLLAKVVEEKLRNLQRAVKANFDPNQPRMPAASGPARVGAADAHASLRRRGSRRIGSDAEGTPEQEARLAAEEVRLRKQSDGFARSIPIGVRRRV